MKTPERSGSARIHNDVSQDVTGSKTNKLQLEISYFSGVENHESVTLVLQEDLVSLDPFS